MIEKIVYNEDRDVFGMTRRKRKFRWAKWLGFLILIVTATIIVILVKGAYFDKKVENSSPGMSEKNELEDKKQENPEEKSVDESVEKAPQYDGESPNKSETLTGLMSYADVVNDELVIRVSIDQFLQLGNCNLVISRNGATYYSTSVPIKESVTTSTCDGFSIPRSELPSGDLQVEIDLESDGKSGKITGRVRL